MHGIKGALAHYSDDECEKVIEVARLVGGKYISAIGPATRVISIAAASMTEILEENEIEEIKKTSPAPAGASVFVQLIYLARLARKSMQQDLQRN